MKQELEYFHVGRRIGGNQDIIIDPVLHYAGCAAIAASESSIFFALHFNRTKLCPNVKERWGYFEYLRFLKQMKPFLYPREGGISRLDLFVEGYSKYLAQVGETGLAMTEFSACREEREAREAIRGQIDRGYLIPFLLLKTQHKCLKDFFWHWFLLTGYEEEGEEFRVRLTSYGEHKWFDLRTLWDTGFEEKGGMILYNLK